MSVHQTLHAGRAPTRPALDLARWGTPLMLLGAWIALIAATALYRPDFISHQTLLAITFTMAIVGVLAIGQALVAISGGFLDLSQPSALIVSALVVVTLVGMAAPTPLVIVAAIATGMVWGLLNATIIVFGRINPVIVTLATNFIGLAVLFLVFRQAEIQLGSPLHAFGRESWLGLPAIWWPMALLVIIVGVLLPKTRYGRRIIAVGGNREAARARGISLKATRFSVFIAAGGFAGLAAVLFAASSGPFDPGAANTLQLNVIAAVILAGISLAGGRGQLWLLLISVGFLSTIPTSLVFFGLTSDAQQVFQGLILVIAVAIDGYQARRSTP